MIIKTCKKCGQLFQPKSTEIICPTCKDHKTMIVGNCLIEEAEGRCQEYYEGKCRECLWPTAMANWIGWRRIKKLD